MKHLRSVFACALVGSLLAMPAWASDLDELGNQLVETYQSAFNSGDAAEVANLYADDAVVLAPNAGRIEGKEAITGLLTVQIQQMGARDLEIEGRETREFGTVLSQSGLYRMTMTGPDGDMPVGGGWLSIVEDAGDGQWVITRHIWNVDLPTE